MRRSTDRILVSHAGTLPRPPELGNAFDASVGVPANLANLVQGVVRRQAEIGVDIVNDGEYGKRGGFSNYVRERFSGIERHGAPPGHQSHDVMARDRRDFPGFHENFGWFGTAASANALTQVNQPEFCTGAIAYTGQAAIQRDISNLQAALQGLDVDGYYPAITPGTIEHWLWNEHYPSEEAFLFAIADALHEEYKAITDAGLVLQLDDPDLPDGWQMDPAMSVADYRAYAQLRVEALNQALRDIPQEQIRLHVCWGSGHGPHKNDIDLRHIVDIVLSVKAECYSVEAANPRHEHDLHVWEEVKLPPGKSLMPGVVTHCTDIIEHPRLVADRLIGYAKLVGRENVIAGTDCGLGGRVGHPEIAWAKLEAMVEGARLASNELWRR